MDDSSLRYPEEEQDDKVMFPGAQAKPSQIERNNMIADGLDGAERLEINSGEFTPALGSDESAILDNSTEFMHMVAALDGAQEKNDSAEDIPAAPEPKLDWQALEESQAAREDDLATVSSASVSKIEDSAAEESTEAEHSPDRAESVLPPPAAGKRRSRSHSGSGSSSRSGSGSSEAKSDSLSDSSSFPGAVGRTSSEPEPETVPPPPPLSPWYRRIPTWKQSAATGTVSLILAVAVLILCLPYFRVSAAEEESSLGMFSEVLSSVFSQGSSERVFQGRDRLNILCLGIDYNRDEKGMGYTAGARSDTIFVISINSEGTILNVLSIPRDIQVYISDAVGYDKINCAYSVGGIELSKKVISEFLQIPIHKYIIIKVAGAAKMVDAVGGLQIDVEKDMDYDDNWGQLHIHLRAGNQLLHGEQAVGYARFRMDEESDRGRIRRQQQTMQALVQRLKDPMVILRLQSIIKAIKENVITDLSVMDMLDLAYLYKDFDRQQMRTGTLVGDDAEVNGASVIVPYEPENRKIVAELFSNINNIERSDVRIEVLNGSGNAKWADSVAETLRQEGFKVTQADADREDYQVTRVVDHLGSVAMRTVIENSIRGCQYETYELDSGSREFDITIIVGQDRRNYQSSPASERAGTPLYIDSGKRSSDGYIDYGNGLSNDPAAMPFEDRPSSAANIPDGSPDEGAYDTPDLPSEPSGGKPEIPTAPAPVNKPSVPVQKAAPVSPPAVNAPDPPAEIPEPQDEPAAEPEPAAETEPAAEPEPQPAPPAPAAEPVPAPVPELEPEPPAAPAPEPVPAAEPAADDDAVLPDQVSI